MGSGGALLTRRRGRLPGVHAFPQPAWAIKKSTAGPIQVQRLLPLEAAVQRGGQRRSAREARLLATRTLAAVMGLCLMLAATDAGAEVAARVETPPSPGLGDALDDAAIWINPRDPARSRIIGSDNQTGLLVYDLAGRQLQVIADGAFNNVDLRPGFELDGAHLTLLAASDRAGRRVALYTIDDDGAFERAGSIDLDFEGYGLCMYVSPRTGTFYVFVTSTGGKVQQWAVEGDSGEVEARLVRTLQLSDRTEGAVADDDLALLYLAEEKVAIWRYGAEPDDGDQRTMVDSHLGGYVGHDVEGLALFRGPGTSGYLIVSNQSEDSFVVYDREHDNRYLHTFWIRAGVLDEVSQTDGIEVTSAALGSRFPYGLFVAQDDKDDLGGQNLKLVDWADIARDADPPLLLGGFEQESADGGMPDGGDGGGDGGADELDGGTDAGVPDAGLPDAAVVEALATDAGLLDAGLAEPLDAGAPILDAALESPPQELIACPAPEPVGCGCSSAAPVAALVVLALLRSRRRR